MKLLRKAVSKKKRRYEDGEFNLDLSYISTRVIAMGFPSMGIERLYRNPLTKVQEFFQRRHGMENVLVVNLCAEKEYDHSFFANVCRIGFRDHNAPPLRYMLVFCRIVNEFFMDANEKRVVAVHCKAGKGRTGLMICCLMLYMGHSKTAQEALDRYGYLRTKDGKGVTIPSQRRYVRYFEHCLRDGFPQRPYARVRLRKVVLSSTPHFDKDGGSNPYFVFLKHESSSPKVGADLEKELFDSRSLLKPVHYGKRERNLTFEFDVELQGDIKLKCMDRDLIAKSETMFTCWFNTSFVAYGNLNGTEPPGTNISAKEGMQVFTLGKADLDKAVKDKKHKSFDEDFTMTLYFEIIDPESRKHVDIGETAHFGDEPEMQADCVNQ